MSTRESLQQSVWVLFLAASTLASAATPTGSPVSSQRVAEALAAQGLSVHRSQIQFLSEVRAASSDSPLQVVSVTRGNPDSKVKLRCRSNRECLPFYIVVHDLQPDDALRASPSDKKLVADATQVQHLIRRGDPATLIMETRDARIRIPVICLENGDPGEKIRVRSKDHFRVYRAEIITPGVLRGEL